MHSNGENRCRFAKIAHRAAILQSANQLTPVQECTQDTGSIDLDLGICRQLLIKPYSLRESREHGGCFANAF